MAIVTVLVPSGVFGLGTALLTLGRPRISSVPLNGDAAGGALAHAPRNQVYYVRSTDKELLVRDSKGEPVMKLEGIARRPSSSGENSNALWQKQWNAFSVVENRQIASISLAKLGKSGRIDWLGEVPEESTQNSNMWLHKWYGWTKLTSQLLFRRFSNEMESDKLVAQTVGSLFVASRLRGNIFEVELPQEGGLVQVHRDKFMLWKHTKGGKYNESECLVIAHIAARGKSEYEIIIDVSMIDIATALLISIIANFRDCI